MGDVTGVIALLETRKKSLGLFGHLIHIFLTLVTGFWGIIYLAHFLTIHFHNRDIEKQQDKVLSQSVAYHGGKQ